MAELTDNRPQNSSRGRAGRESSVGVSGVSMMVGSAALTGCASMALLMALDHLGRMKLPGCGPDSACAAASAGRFGSIPGIDWPVSFVGLAFYAAVGAAWSASREGVSAALRIAVRLGGAVSIGFVAIMLIERAFCSYCLTAHLAYFVFWFLVERAPLARGKSLRQVLSAAPMFALISAALLPIELMERSAVRAQAESDLAESTARMVESPQPRSRFSEIAAGTSDVPVIPSMTLTESGGGGESGFLPGGLTGRHRIGSEQSPMRMVVFSDYQCKDCRRIENEIRSLIEQRDDISLAARHFPMCNDCNRHVPNKMHANACWAARAAEAAAVLRGTDGFWRMHRWLFEREGAFTSRELKDALPELGYAPTEFLPVMTGEETLAVVREDIELAVELGLHYTPMIFINGVELRGWNAPSAVTRAVKALAASHPPSLSAAGDRPPPAIEKYIEDWRRQRTVSFVDETDWALGSESGPVDVVMFGDYRAPNCAEADRVIRRLVTDSGDVRYHYRHYPFNRDCNPFVSKTPYPLACLAARGAEAAGALGGGGGYWKMHAWLFENQADFSETALSKAAAELGFGADAFAEAMESEAVAAAIAEDVRVGRAMRFRGIPAIFINGKYLPRWRRDGKPILDRIIAEAAAP